MKIKEDAKVIYSDGKLDTTVYDDREVCKQGLQPFLFVSKDGTLLAQYQLPEPPKGTRQYNFSYRVENYVSRDGGDNWDLFKMIDENLDDPFIEAGMIQLQDGRIFTLDTYVQEEDGHPGFGYGEGWFSSDDLKTFEGPLQSAFTIPDVTYSGSTDDDGHVSRVSRLHRSIAQLPDGSLLMTMYARFVGDDAPASYEPRMMKTRTFIVKSEDLGKSWRYLSTVAVDAGIGTEGFGEPCLQRIAHGPHEGRLLCVMRTGRDLYQAFSDDEGMSWSYFKPLTFEGINIYDINAWKEKYEGKFPDVSLYRKSMSGAVVDPDITQMENGAVVLSFGVRLPAQLNWQDPSVENNGVYAAFSLDGGDTWSHVVRVMGGKLTTHYTGVREFEKDTLYFAYDVGSWREGGRGGRGCKIKVTLK